MSATNCATPRVATNNRSLGFVNNLRTTRSSVTVETAALAAIAIMAANQ